MTTWPKFVANVLLNEMPRWVDADKVDTRRFFAVLSLRYAGVLGPREWRPLLEAEYEAARR